MSNIKRTKGPFDASRRIAVASGSPEQLHQAIQRLRAMAPVIDVELDRQNRLHVVYDASRLGMREIESLLGNSGITPGNGFWMSLKQGWYRFLDDNARENARTGSGACCNRPPPVPSAHHHSGKNHPDD